MNTPVVVVDSKQARATIRGLSNFIASPKKALDEAARNLAILVTDGFRNESDPYGNAWAPNSPVTLSMRKGASGGILHAVGTLFNSIRSGLINQHTAFVTIGGPGMWAGVLHDGNPDNLMYGKAPAPIPPRPMIPDEGRPLPAAWDRAVEDPFTWAIEHLVKQQAINANAMVAP